MVVVLPAPFGPRKATTSPGPDVQVEAVDRLDVSEGLPQAGGFNSRGRGAGCAHHRVDHEVF